MRSLICVNDTYGHRMGDEVLRWLALLVRETVRETDFPTRYGGEEFAIIMPRTTVEDAHVVADRLRCVVASGRFVSRSNDAQSSIALGLTISVGIAGVGVNAADEDALVGSADAALYRAKGRGRNRTVRAVLAGSKKPKLVVV